MICAGSWPVASDPSGRNRRRGRRRARRHRRGRRRWRAAGPRSVSGTQAMSREGIDAPGVDRDRRLERCRAGRGCPGDRGCPRPPSTTRTSSVPSPVTSATTGAWPGRSIANWPAAMNVPSPLPSNTETSLESALATARSSRPSPLKSPRHEQSAWRRVTDGVRDLGGWNVPSPLPSSTEDRGWSSALCDGQVEPAVAVEVPVASGIAGHRGIGAATG